ncbi:hypothetical protein FHETE_897 [Fusarium heterosporum]|uniref:MGAT4 conserved region domain-containing protein n=1 Tax=Fusarium heterosporum TaxID=42747 RepID=A0A8H5X0T9_FUSHE|nr:hypothetical protein FHETE_897 [Fusarium heterosporum]
MLIPRSRKILAVYASLASVWIILFQLCRLYTYSDPSSFFYDRHRAYQTHYTDTREKEAEDFLALADAETIADVANISLINNDAVTRSKKKQQFCIGVPSVKRDNEQFLPKALASLVQGLSIEERQAIHIVVLLADDNPARNPAFGQTWLSRLADEVLFYGDRSLPDISARYHNITKKQLHGDQGLSRNGRVHRDYATLMATCRDRRSDYFVLIEDDVIAAKYWLKSLSSGLKMLERTANMDDWLYLRLFYSETYLGWNLEEWPIYVMHWLCLYTVVLVLYLLLATFDSVHRAHTLHLKPLAWNVLHLTFWLASFITLYFLAGRLTVAPLPTGVHEMANYGCCAQGLVIPQQHLEGLKSNLETAPDIVAGDSFIEEYADQNQLKKYAITPSILQHVGIQGSSDTKGTKKLTWNFSFERNNDKILK